MADKRKTTGRSTQVAQTRTKTSTSENAVKSISEMARDERAEEKQVTSSKATAQKTTSEIKGVKSIGALARDTRDTKNTNASEGKKTERVEKIEPVKATKAAAVSTTSSSAARTKPRRDSKQPSWLVRLRRSRFGNFVYEAYYELRHKVTWPTFEEARNMTVVVIVLSAVIGAFLAAVDYGLYNLFLLISGGK